MTDPSSRDRTPAPGAPTAPVPAVRPPAAPPPAPFAGGEDAPAPRSAPARPPIVSPNAAPVLTKLTPPFSVRVSELFWILSFFIGGFAIVYSFIIRKEQLPLIIEAVKTVDPTRNEATFTTAADIIFWTMFGLMVGVVLVQITLLVSFMGRRPKVRWWQLLTWVIQVLTLALALDLALTGERAMPLRLIMAAQCALVLLALLASVMPKALAWTARRHDVIRHQKGEPAATL